MHSQILDANYTRKLDAVCVSHIDITRAASTKAQLFRVFLRCVYRYRSIDQNFTDNLLDELISAMVEVDTASEYCVRVGTNIGLERFTECHRRKGALDDAG